jgi:hypothetical protein
VGHIYKLTQYIKLIYIHDNFMSYKYHKIIPGHIYKLIEQMYIKKKRLRPLNINYINF